jgi:polar amino acid transport system substrate-binding protein
MTTTEVTMRFECLSITSRAAVNSKTLTIALSIIFLTIFGFHPKIVEAKELRFALLEWPPHTTKKMVGFGVASELVSAVTKEMNIEAKYQFFPLKRVLHRVKDGKDWAAFPGSYTNKRAETFYYSDPIFPQVDRFFYYKSKPNIKFKELKDLKNLTVGGTKGFWYADDFKKAGLKTYYVADDILAMKMLVGGRINLVAVNDIVGWQIIKEHFPDKISSFGVLEKPLRVKENFLLASKKYPDSLLILKKFNQALKIVKDNGTYLKIANKYNLQQQGSKN